MAASSNLHSVFYAESYHPIQAGSIDGTDILPHDHAVYRASLCSSAGLYDPFGDPKATGDPYCTIFVGRLSRLTTEETLHKVMSKYGHVKNLRLVRDIVTGASRGYAFVEFETEREMQWAYMEAHHSFIDDCEIIVDYNRQKLMPGWIPRRLGGGLGGKKESGQLRFGGRERPFRAPLRPIPYEELKKLGIPPPPEGRYMSRHQVPPAPRRSRSFIDHEESSRRNIVDHLHRKSSMEREEHHFSARGSPSDREEPYQRRRSMHRNSISPFRSSKDQEGSPERKMSHDKEFVSRNRGSADSEEHSYKMNSRNRDKSSHKRSSRDKKDNGRKRHKHSRSKSRTHERWRSYSRSQSPEN